MPSLRTRVPAVLFLLLAAIVVAPSGTHAAEGQTVMFPATTRIGPDAPPYVVQVDAPTFDHVRVTSLGWSVDAPPVGSVTVELPREGPQDVTVEGCTADGSCTFLDRSPSLLVRRTLGLELPVSIEQRVGPSRPDVVLAFPWPEEDRDGSLTWRVLTPAGAELASGSATYAPMSGYLNGATFPLVLPASVRDGELRIEVDAVDLVDGFGELRSTTAGTIRWDTTVKATLSLVNDDVYPEVDGYRDVLPIQLSRDEELADGRLEIVDASGAVVRGLMTPDEVRDSECCRRWDGTDGTGAPVAPGSYAVRATLVDRAGNESVIEQPFEVLAGRLRTITWRQTFRAADTVVDTAVGRCSDYRTPSSRGDRGSFQLASQTRCRTASQSHAIALSGVYLPPSVGVEYADLRVEMRGGPSLATKEAYVVLGFLRKDESLGQRTVADDGYGRYRLTLPKPGASVRTDDEGRHYVLWQAGLSEGSRWDVETYTLSARIQVLR